MAEGEENQERDEGTVATDEIRPSTRQVCGETVKVNAPMVNALFCVAL